jgi:hypothetical protein
MKSLAYGKPQMCNFDSEGQPTYSHHKSITTSVIILPNSDEKVTIFFANDVICEISNYLDHLPIIHLHLKGRGRIFYKRKDLAIFSVQKPIKHYGKTSSGRKRLICRRIRNDKV